MSNLLLDDKPLLILPSLAEKIGLNESIVMQQLHYWLKDSNNFRDGYKWVYNTYANWKVQFPFWSDKTIRRIITKLENEGLIITGNYNKLGIDKTKWYRIDYTRFEILTSPSGQNDHTSWTSCPVGKVNMTTPLPEITTEITSEKEKEEDNSPSCENPFRFFEENGFGAIGGHISEKIGMWCDDLSDSLVLEAMKIAVERGVKNWVYVETILVSWADKKVKTVEQAHAIMLAFKENQSKQHGKNYKPRRQEKLPNWFDEDNKGNNPIPVSSEINSEVTDVGELLKEFRDRKNKNDSEQGTSPDDEIHRKKIALEERLKKYRN